MRVMPIAPQLNIIRSGLVHWLDASVQTSYPGSGTAWSDLSGNGLNGSHVNGPTFNSSNGGSIAYDGTNDRTDFNNSSLFQNQNFTLSFWIYYNASQNAAIKIICDYDHQLGTNFVIQSEDANNNRFFYLVYYSVNAFQPAGNFGAGKGVQLDSNAWQNIVYTKSGTTIKGHKNGTLLWNVTAANGTVTYSSKQLSLAGWKVSNERNINGRIGQYLMYNRALTQDEITHNFNTQRRRFGI